MKSVLSRVRAGVVAAVWCGTGGDAFAQGGWWDRWDDALYYETPNGFWRLDGSGLLDVEGYYIDQRPPGLLFADPGDDFLFSPRLSLFVDTTLGDHFYGFLQVRADRGFDPGADENGDLRADEWLVRYTPFKAPMVNVQAGKFATVVGNWVPRHLSWENPLITAPLAYENVTPMTDQVVPGGAAGFVGRKNSPDNKEGWLPVIWGPSYGAGASMFGVLHGMDYAFEIKNAALSSRPVAWDPWNRTWEDPTYSGRLGYRPNASWNFGMSGSYGAYLLEAAKGTLPAGRELDDYDQSMVGADVSYAWRHWQLWGEMFWSEFEVPNVGDAETVVYYLEGKYKFDEHWFGALRWNQQFYGDVPDGAGGETGWDNDIWRVDAAVGYRFDLNWQAKVQYSYSRQGGEQQQGEQLVAGQLTMRF